MEVAVHAGVSTEGDMNVDSSHPTLRQLHDEAFLLTSLQQEILLIEKLI